LSNLNGFSKFLHCWKPYKNLLQEAYIASHHTLIMLLQYRGKSKVQICLKLLVQKIQCKNHIMC